VISKQRVRDSSLAIQSILEAQPEMVWGSKDLEVLLAKTKNEWGSGNTVQDANILALLADRRILRTTVVDYNRGTTLLYVSPNAHRAEIGLAVRRGSYLAYFTALHLWDLTKTIPKLFQTNLEQFKKRQGEKPELEQLNVDKSFARPMRQSSEFAEFEFTETKYRAQFLSGIKTERLGVTTVQIGGRELPVTDVERTLIDALVRPIYCGGVDEVLHAFQKAKDRCSVKRTLSYLKKMDFIYPYHQLLGFYLERAGYPAKELEQIEKIQTSIDFYLTYEMREKNYSKKWKVYYPAELD